MERQWDGTLCKAVAVAQGGENWWEREPVASSPKRWDKVQIKSTSVAAAKLLQSCLTLCNPIDVNPPGSPVPGILQARTLEWVAISFSNAWKWKVKVKLLSRVTLFVTPWTAAYQAPPSMGFSRQEYWSGVPLPSLKKQFSASKLTAQGQFTSQQHLQSAGPRPHLHLLEKRMTPIQKHQWLIAIILLKCHIQAPLHCHSEV